MDTPILRVEDLTTGYGDLRVVWNVSFDVYPSSVFSILGRNGVGKTTTLRAIAGLNPAMSGRVLLEGTDVTKVPPYRRVQRGLGYVQEGKKIIPDLTVEENLELGGFVLKGGKAHLRQRIEESYEMFPILADRRKTQATLLSGGQQQMLAIAQAIVPEPKVLLVDEPSGGLAPAIVGDVLDILDRLRQQGLAIVLVEQSVDFALRIARDVIVLDLGRVAHRGPADEPGVFQVIQDAYMGNIPTS